MERSRVYIFAYACDPGAGSEPGTGWTWLAATLQHNDVRLFTDNHNPLEKLRARAQSFPGHLAIEVVSAGRFGSRIAIAGRLRHLRYLLWIHRAGRRARKLESNETPALAHHLTYAADWLPSPAAWLKVTPFIWGPVGGATYPSLGLLSVLPARNIASELLRSISTQLTRCVLGWRTIRRAALAVAMNEDTGHLLRRLRRGQEVVVEPHVAIDTVRLPPLQPNLSNTRTAVFAGRLIPWKGVSLAIRALGQAPGWRLHVYGDGPQLTGLQRIADRLDIADRVRFYGRVDRDRVLDALSSADAFLFPSLHDANSWAVAEAMSMGIPVVCLDIGGPPVIAGPRGVPVVPNRAVIHNLGIALKDLQERGPRDLRWDVQRLPGILEEWYGIVRANVRL